MRIPFISDWLEKRSTLANPAQWLVDALTGGSKSAAGVSVTESKALTASGVYACVKILAETVASLPLPVYRRLSPRGKERAPDHPLYYILHDEPNPEMTAFTFKEALMGHLTLWGNAYAEIEWGANGRPRALWPLRPDNTWPERDSATKKIIYKTIIDGTTYVLPAQNVLHILGLSAEGLVGYSPIRMAREAIGLSLAAEEFGSRLFSNGAHPGGIIEYPNKLRKEAREQFEKSIKEAYSGLSKSHRLMVLEEGLKYHQVAIPPDDAQFLETRKFQLNEICRIFRVPPHMVGDLERATFSNIEHQSLEFVMYTIRPWLVRWEQAIHSKLFSRQERQTYFAEFLIEGLLRGDVQARSQFYREMFMIGAMSQNDIREKENMNPIEGGDTYYVPLNMVPADMARKVQEPTEQNSRQVFWEQRSIKVADNRRLLAKRYEKVFEDAAQRIVNREVADIKRALDKHFARRDATSFNQWLEQFYREAPEWIQRVMTPVVFSYAGIIQANIADELDIKPGMTPELEEFVQTYVNTFATRYVASSQGQINALLVEALDNNIDPVEKVVKRLKEWEEKRPRKVAMRETIQVAGAVALKVYKTNGVTRLKWRARGDSCKFCQKLDGTVVGIEQTFAHEGSGVEADGETLTPRGKVMHPPLHAGCDCVVVAVQD